MNQTTRYIISILLELKKIKKLRSDVIWERYIKANDRQLNDNDENWETAGYKGIENKDE